jgi:drug/metabolite transporter (DMT)-like permease
VRSADAGFPEGQRRGDGRQRAGPPMTVAALAFLMAGVLLNAGAQLLLKAGTNVLGVLTLTRDTWPDTLARMATQGYFVLGAGCYVLSLFVWILGLSRVPVSVAYPLLSVGYIVNAIAAHFLFGEAVTASRWLGIGFIVVGVWLVAKS